MTDGKKKPTNGDLLAKLNKFEVVLAEVPKLRTDVNKLMEWKIQEDAYRAALKTVRDEEEQKTWNNGRDKLVKQALYVLGLLAAALVAYLATKGISV